MLHLEDAEAEQAAVGSNRLVGKPAGVPKRVLGVPHWMLLSAPGGFDHSKLCHCLKMGPLEWLPPVEVPWRVDWVLALLLTAEAAG